MSCCEHHIASQEIMPADEFARLSSLLQRAPPSPWPCREACRCIKCTALNCETCYNDASTCSTCAAGYGMGVDANGNPTGQCTCECVTCVSAVPCCES